MIKIVVVEFRGKTLNAIIDSIAPINIGDQYIFADIEPPHRLWTTDNPAETNQDNIKELCMAKVICTF